eukprot:4209307-Alexandrium_andersonii.AAC.1
MCFARGIFWLRWHGGRECFSRRIVCSVGAAGFFCSVGPAAASVSCTGVLLCVGAAAASVSRTGAQRWHSGCECFMHGREPLIGAGIGCVRGRGSARPSTCCFRRGG